MSHHDPQYRSEMPIIPSLTIIFKYLRYFNRSDCLSLYVCILVSVFTKKNSNTPVLSPYALIGVGGDVLNCL
jgi:hypothetical protein